MSVFKLYMHLGFGHIINVGAFDHILFIVCISAVYMLSDWKKVLILITAFTIGHTTTLVLSTFRMVNVNSALVEFMIPITILLTSIGNMVVLNEDFSVRLHRFKYLMAMFFGLIHGLGFSANLRALLGNESSIIKPLFAFNLGLEIGQLLIVLIILILASIAIKVFNVAKREWLLVLSGAGLGVSILFIFERFSELAG